MSTCIQCGSEVGGLFCSSCGTRQPTGGALRMAAGALFVELLEDGLVDPQLSREVMHRAVAEHGGRVDTVASGAALAIFMAPFVKVDPALALVRGADSLRSSLQENRSIQWRAGAAYGDALVMDEETSLTQLTIAGTARDLAATAAPYQVLLGKNAARAAGRWCLTRPLRDDIEIFVELNPEAKLGQDLFGREHETTTIQALFERTKRERSAQRLLLVAGAGVGKTSLVENFVGGLGGSAIAATGTCPPQALSPFGPLEEIVTKFAELDPDAPGESLRDRLAEEPEGHLVAESIAGLLGWEDHPSTGAPYWGLRRLFEFISRYRPCVVVFDDVHWADEALLDAVDHLISFLTGAPVFFVMLARSEVLERRPHLGVATGNHAVMTLETLQAGEALMLIERAAGATVELDLARAIENASAGNPLFLVEIVAHLKDQGLIQLVDGHWRPTEALNKIPIAPGVRTLIEIRVTSLKPSERKVLEACSVQDVTFDATEVEVASEEPIGTVLSGLVSLRQNAFIELAAGGSEGIDRFRFKHGLIHEATYGMSSKESRARMHERMGRWTVESGRYGDIDERAGHHLESAYRLAVAVRSAGEREIAIGRTAATHLATAGRALAVRGHLPSAAGFLKRALALYPPRDPGWVNTAIDLAECHVEIGNYQEGYSLLDELERITDDIGNPQLRLRAEVSRLQIDAATSFADDKLVIDRINELAPQLEALGDNTGMSKLRRAQAEVHWVRGHCAEAASALELAIYHSWMSPSQRLLPRVVSQMTAVMRWGPVPTSAAIHVCQRILELTGADPLTKAGVGIRIAALRGLQGDFDDARRLATESISALEELGQLQVAAASTQDIGLIELLAGNTARAAELFKDGLDRLIELEIPGFAASNAAFLARALHRLDRTEEAAKYLDLAHELADEDPTLRADTLPVRALLAADAGNEQDALRFVEEARSVAGETDMLPIRAGVEMDAAEVFLKLGRGEAAADAARAAIELAVRKEATALMLRAEKLLAEVSG